MDFELPRNTICLLAGIINWYEDYFYTDTGDSYDQPELVMMNDYYWTGTIDHHFTMVF